VKPLNNLLHNITMYRLVMYGLLGLAGVSVLFGFTGVLGFSGGRLLGSLALFITVCWVSNLVFARLTNAATSSESSVITALILYFIFTPPATIERALLPVVVAFIAIASKYLVAYRKRHIFNPAAFAAVIVGLLGLVHASWWVANDTLIIFSLIGGVLILQKLHRWQLFFAFFIPAAVLIMLTSLQNGFGFTQTARDIVVSWPLIFLGTIMLTEPFTQPPRKKYLAVYGVLVGVLVGSRLRLAGITMTPELALVIGNLFAYSVGLRQRLTLTFTQKKELAPATYSFAFEPQQPFTYLPGQYLEVTLPHPKPDMRGTRRVFSIASSPTEPIVTFGVKIAERSSTFKTALMELKPGQFLPASRLAGDFVLPAKPDEKLLFIAGGIGITPFRSMIKYLIDTNQRRDIILLYQVRTMQDAVYRAVFDEAQTYGIQTIYIETNPAASSGAAHETGFITHEVLRRHVPDIAERITYISGPSAMVDTYRKLVVRENVPRRRIITDYFSGY
jgi:glycine betaine catabolism B